MIDSDNQKYDTGKYIGDSYRDLTRIANINEDLWTELFFTNKDNLHTKYLNFEDQLDIMKRRLLEREDIKHVKKAMFIESSEEEEEIFEK